MLEAKVKQMHAWTSPTGTPRGWAGDSVFSCVFMFSQRREDFFCNFAAIQYPFGPFAFLKRMQNRCFKILHIVPGHKVEIGQVPLKVALRVIASDGRRHLH